MEEQDFKGQLISYCNKLGLSVKFQEASSTGPSHDPRFTVHVFVNDTKMGVGEDKRKNSAANIAAKMALQSLQNGEQEQDQVEHAGAHVSEHVHPRNSALNTSIEPSPVNGATSMIGHEPNYVGIFNEFCQKKGWKCYSFVDNRRGPDHIPEFFCHAIIGDQKFPEAKGKNKKEAKQNAAYLALRVFKKEDPTNVQLQRITELDDGDVTQAGSTSESKSANKTDLSRQIPGDLPLQPESSPSQAHFSEHVVHPMASALSTSTEHSEVNDSACKIGQEPNYVGMFNEFCQKKGWMRYSFVDDRIGPDHIPEFVCHAIIGDRKFPEAKGKNKKEAKKNAAYLALRVFKREDPNNIQLQRIPALEDGENIQATSTSESNRAKKTNSSQQTSEDKPSQSKTSDSQVTFHSSFTANSVTPNKLHRRCELAARFPKKEVLTKDPTFLRDFDNITELGFGGYGTIFKARKKMDEKYYVVKKVKRRSEKDLAEITVLADLKHTHIVQYFHSWAGEDVFPDDSCSGDSQTQMLKCLFIQMEWCTNGTLENWIEKMEKIEKAKSLNIFKQIVDGVEYIHSKKLIHRDLKPANILFAEDMVVKIADFGLVTPISENLEDDRLQRTAKKGTKRYMAPEQEENQNYENEVDIFSLGLILIELFWKFSTLHAKQSEWEKIRNADLPPQFVKQFPFGETIIKLMLSVDPKKRPTAAQLKKYFFENQSVFNSNTL